MFLYTIKPIDLCDLPALVIASEDNDLIRIPGLQCCSLCQQSLSVISVCVCVCVSYSHSLWHTYKCNGNPLP